MSSSSGGISAETGAADNASGGRPATRKNTFAEHQSESGGPAALKASLVQPSFRRHEMMTQSIASASVAGAGPNSSAEATTNVSETVMVAATDTNATLNEPVISASSANSAHSSGCGAERSDASASASTTTPDAATAPT